MHRASRNIEPFPLHLSPNLPDAIGQLRQKLEADPSSPNYIITEPGIGYRLLRFET
ncbi:winged helix-turn-helix domain-containing protein [Devosia naphthalenivorans]|uniref:winged helix-turn-helix domain-containing protein n=1 Tax=Devosia naphthalenivorans TaxID=2082392 RepID=UPI0013B06A08